MLTIDKIYKYDPADYTDDGWTKVDDNPLFQYIDECQLNFYEEHTPFVANILFVNPSTARLLHKCFQFEDNEILGLDMIDGQIDFEANSQMEKHGNKHLIYGIGCAVPGHEEDQPVMVVLDVKLKGGEFRLSYYQDYDQDEDDDDGDDIDPSPEDILLLERIRANVKM